LVIRDSSDAFAPPRESDNPDNGSIPSDTAEMLIREIEAKLREAANRSAAARSVSSGRGIPSPTPASAAFRERIDEIVALEPNWDLAGAEPISAATGKMVLQVAEAVLDLAAEPFVGPAPDGTVLLQWTMADGRVIDAYVGEEWPEFVMVDDSGEVVEVEIPEPEALRRQLKSR